MKLSNTQKKAISILASSPLAEKFYWTGGTLLSFHYLNHRNSLDLDFFSEKEFTFDEVNELANKIKKEIGFKKINFKKIFDRFEFIFKSLPLLSNLKPLIEKQSDQEKENLIRKIEMYFKDESSAFLRGNLV